MPWKTTFVCEDVRFSTDEHPGSPGGDDWSSVKVSVHDLGVETPWLLVEKFESKDPSLPVIFRAMRGGWKISCDEHTMTMTVHGDEVETLTMGNQKLRFDRAMDFWTLMYQISLSRLGQYATQNTAEEDSSVVQTDMEY